MLSSYAYFISLPLSSFLSVVLCLFLHPFSPPSLSPSLPPYSLLSPSISRDNISLSLQFLPRVITIILFKENIIPLPLANTRWTYHFPANQILTHSMDINAPVQLFIINFHPKKSLLCNLITNHWTLWFNEVQLTNNFEVCWMQTRICYFSIFHLYLYVQLSTVKQFDTSFCVHTGKVTFTLAQP